MSEDSKDNTPPKLRLSRDLKAPPDSEKAENTSNHSPTKTPTNAPATKRERESDIAPAVERSVPPTKEPYPEPENKNQAQESEPQNGKGTFDPKNPFGDQIKRGEIKAPTKAPASPPPELPAQPTPKAEDRSGTRIEEAVNSLHNEGQPKKHSNSIILSIVVIVLLMCLLFGSGFGLWVLLRSGSEPDSSEQVAKEPTTSKATPSNPIEKAKATIAKVPVVDVEAMTGEKSEPTIGENTEPITKEEPDGMVGDTVESVVEANTALAPPEAENVAENATKETETVEQEKLRFSNRELETSKQSVSRYLSNVRISGVRKGENPAVMIGGERFAVGETVDPAIGLKFDGLRDGRLAFRDRYEIVYLKSF